MDSGLPLLVAMSLAPTLDGGLSMLETEAEAPIAVTSEGALRAAPTLRGSSQLRAPPLSSASHTELSRIASQGDSLYLGYASINALVELDRTYGDERHRYPSAGAVRSEALTVEDGVIFCDAAGYTWYYPEGDDAPRWSHFGGAPITSRPTLHEGILYVASVDDVVYALDVNDGSLIWRYERPEDFARQSELTLFGAPSPVIQGDTVLAGFSDGAITALSLDAGELLWDRRVGEGRYPDVTAPPVFVDGDAYVSGFSEPLVSLDLETRNVRWRLDVGGAWPPAVDGDVLYHGATDGKLRAINRLTGAVAWTWDSETSGAITTPQITPAGVLITSSDGGIHLLDPETGEETWSFDVGYILNGVAAPPLIVGDDLYAITNAGNILHLAAPAPGPEFTPPEICAELPRGQ